MLTSKKKLQTNEMKLTTAYQLCDQGSSLVPVTAEKKKKGNRVRMSIISYSYGSICYTRLQLYAETTVVKREKGESLIFIIFTERLTTTLHIGLIYIHTHGSHNTVRKKEGKDCTIFNTPPQAEAYMSYATSLLQMYLIIEPLRDLVKMSVS